MKAKRLAVVARVIRREPQGKPMTFLMLARLLFAWGNPGYSAGVRYLQQIDRLFGAGRGAVLECGSGATTVLLGLLAEKYDRYVWVFEHHEEWARHIGEVCRELGLDRVNVRYTPLRNYGEYDWYQLPTCPFPRDFDLVVCDGPPGGIQGGRYGLLPVMSQYLRSDCRILLDDTHRRKEKELIRRWANEQKLHWSRLGTTGRCAEIAFA